MKRDGTWSVGVFDGDDDSFYNLFCVHSTTCLSNATVTGELTTGEGLCCAFVDGRSGYASVEVAERRIEMRGVTKLEMHRLFGCARDCWIEMALPVDKSG